MTDSRFRLNDADMIFERFDQEIVAIQLVTGTYHSVSGVGLDAFLLLSAEPTIFEMAGILAEKYDAPTSRIEQDLKLFLEQLRKESLIIPFSGGSSKADRACIAHSGPRLPYNPPVIEPFRDLEGLLVVDPVHDVAPVGWPQPKPLRTAGAAKEVRYCPRGQSGMIFERFDEETLAMNVATGAYHSLVGPAEDIFLLLADEPTLSEVVEALHSKYSASESEVAEAAGEFLDALVRAGLAETVALESPAQPQRQLALAKPGVGNAFVAPSLDTFRSPAAPTVLQAGPGASSLSSARKRFRFQDAGLMHRRAGCEAIVISPEKGYYYVLNSSAAVVLQLLEQRPTASELVQTLARLYEIEQRELTGAVLVLLHNLSREGLITADAAGQESPRQLDTSRCGPPLAYEPFSILVYRDQQHLFLPFPGTTAVKPEGTRSGRSMASMMRAYFEQAAERAGESEVTFRIAGQNVRVRCAGALDASQMGLAFSHLTPAPPNRADFTIHVWDGESGGKASNSFLAGFLSDFYARWAQACGPRGEVLPFHSQEIPVLYHVGPDILSLVDAENHVAYYLKRDDSPLPYWEIGSPFRAILHYWLSRRSMQFIHGGAIGGAGGGVVLSGKGGAGKSTTALACIDAGMCYAGDDYCAVELNGTPYLHSLYNSAKLKGKPDFERFPHLEDRVWNATSFADNTGDKAIFFLSQLWPHRITRGFPIRALLIPHITGNPDTYLSDCSEAQALVALSASTIAQLPMAGPDDLNRLGEIVGRLPRYVLNLGTDLAQIPRVIQSVL